MDAASVQVWKGPNYLDRSLHLISAFCVALRGPSVFGLRSSVTSVSSFFMLLQVLLVLEVHI